MHRIPNLSFVVKGIVSDSNNIFIWHESEDNNGKKNKLILKFQ